MKSARKNWRRSTKAPKDNPIHKAVCITGWRTGHTISIMVVAISVISCYNDGDNFDMKEIPMRNFDYIKAPEALLTPEIVQMIGSIHEHKGKQELFLEANVDELKNAFGSCVYPEHRRFQQN